jgi:hypothetical protein
LIALLKYCHLDYFRVFHSWSHHGVDPLP